jgi:DNA-binding transcriptional ArsR family regulator
MSDRLHTFHALAHPARLRLLSLLTGAALSAAEAARELGMSQANASYHLRRLERAGLVQVVEEVTVRGGHARRYRHTTSSVPTPPAPGPQPTTPALREAEHEYIALLCDELRHRFAQRTGGPRPTSTPTCGSSRRCGSTSSRRSTTWRRRCTPPRCHRAPPARCGCR